MAMATIRSKIECACGYQVLQRHAVQILHGDERVAFVAANFIDGADIGVIERRCASCFPAKTFQSKRVLGCGLGQELEGDKSAEFVILGFVDYTHATAPEFLQDTVARDDLPARGMGLGHTRCYDGGASPHTGNNASGAGKPGSIES
jgi:hypothetical protein